MMNSYLKHKPVITRRQWLENQLAKCEELLDTPELSDEHRGIVLVLQAEFQEDISTLNNRKDDDDQACC